MGRTFVGIGFGPIQGGLFVYEAMASKQFDRLVVAEVMPELVEAVRRCKGAYSVNVATRTGVETRRVETVEMLNPTVSVDAGGLVLAVAEASEVATGLPNVKIFEKGSPSVAAILAGGIRRKIEDPALPSCVVYAGENHNHAAEILEAAVRARLPPALRERMVGRVQFLNTVIGKMSGVVTDPGQIERDGLVPLVEGWNRAFLVEEFNRILVTAIRLPGFTRGIGVFVEKPDLLPFEEAKLYGHNAVHALLGYLAFMKRYTFMSEVAADTDMMTLARDAFLQESGRALMHRYAGVDPLFTEDGYRAYADDLLERMMNPHLKDQVARVIRDPRRKLAWDDRLIGTMRRALDAGIQPERFALGAAAAMEQVRLEQPDLSNDMLFEQLWPEDDEPAGRKEALRRLILGD